MPWFGMWQARKIYCTGISGESEQLGKSRCRMDEGRFARVKTGQTLLNENDIEKYVTQRFETLRHQPDHGSQPALLFGEHLLLPEISSGRLPFLFDNLMESKFLHDGKTGRPLHESIIELTDCRMPEVDKSTGFLSRLLKEKLKGQGYAETLPVAVQLAERAVAATSQEEQEFLADMAAQLCFSMDREEDFLNYSSEHPDAAAQLLEWHGHLRNCGYSKNHFHTAMGIGLNYAIPVLCAQKYTETGDENDLIGLPIIENFSDMSTDEIKACFAAVMGWNLPGSSGSLYDSHIIPVLHHAQNGEALPSPVSRALLNIGYNSRKRTLITTYLFSLSSSIQFSRDDGQMKLCIPPERSLLATALLAANRSLKTLDPKTSDEPLNVRREPLDEHEQAKVLNETMRYATLVGFTRQDAADLIAKPEFSRLLFGQTAAELAHSLKNPETAVEETIHYWLNISLYELNQTPLLEKIKQEGLLGDTDVVPTVSTNIKAEIVVLTKPLHMPKVQDTQSVQKRPRHKNIPQLEEIQLSFEF